MSMEESREMAAMEDETFGAQPNYLQIANLLREQLSSFLKSGYGELPGEKLRRLLYMAASHKVVSYAVMNLALWGNLPRELLVLVLAHLPVPEITRLRCHLSKEWIMNLEFNRACDEANPNMAALLLQSGKVNAFSIRIFDFSKSVWLHEYCFRLTNRGNAPSWFDSIRQTVWMPMASDGGLVCFVSTWKYTEANPLCILVMNLLTRVHHELPPLQYVYTVPPTLVHMKVDSRTKGYKVVVVVHNEGLLTVETYDSVSRQWSKAAPSCGRILGLACEWKIAGRNYIRWRIPSPRAYNLEEGQRELLDCDLVFQSERARVMQYALVGDRLFVLHEKLDRHDMGSGSCFITEFQSQNSAEVWVPVRTHDRCFPGGRDSSFDLHACEDVLVLRKLSETDRTVHFLNFSTSEWGILPPNLPVNQYVSRMCRVFWNVIP